jgi:hypothetical protein
MHTPQPQRVLFDFFPEHGPDESLLAAPTSSSPFLLLPPTFFLFAFPLSPLPFFLLILFPLRAAVAAPTPSTVSRPPAALAAALQRSRRRDGCSASIFVMASK